METQIRQKELDGKVASIAQSSKSLGQSFLAHITDSKRWQEDLIEEIRATYRLDNSHPYAPPDSLLELYRGNRASDFRQRVLHKLRYREILDRFDRIPEAHKATFRWIYDESCHQDRPWQNYSTFLKDDTNIYWITGKAGAGKSTLMKYLFENPQTYQLLSSTRVPHLQKLDLVCAGFFFWNSGTAVQMSQEGLLRTLLHTSLEKCENVFPVIFPDLWEAYYLFDSLPDEEWMWTGLVRAFKNLLKIPGKRFCFFVDGLDEFHNDESKIRELIDFLKSIADQGNVKLCVASRPWVIFEDAFRLNSSLMLENLTFADIKDYTKSNLGGHPAYRDLEVEEPKYAASLVEKIAQKSAGVFLWVTLVVGSLLAGITNGDRISDLERRLAALPSDLEELFSKILDSIDPLYKSHACRFFMLVRLWNVTEISIPKFGPASFLHEDIPLTVMHLYFADLENVLSSLDFPVQELAIEEKESKQERMRRRVNSRCKGLLECSKPSDDGDPTIEYLHRSVKDFIEQGDTWNGVVHSAGSSYDPYLHFCASILLQMKTISELSHSLLWRYLFKALHYAKMSVKFSNGSTIDSLVLILDDLDHSTRQIMDCMQNTLYEPCISHIGATTNYPTYTASFLNIALHYGLDWYIKKKITKDELKSLPRLARPLLICAVKRCEFSSLDIQLLPPNAEERDFKTSLVRILLEAGQDPNCCLDGESPLCIVNERLRNVGDVGGMWQQIVKLLIQYGATTTHVTTENHSTKYLEIELPDLESLVGTGYEVPVCIPVQKGRERGRQLPATPVQQRRERGERLSVIFKNIFRRN